jgi:hypothetical protein
LILTYGVPVLQKDVANYLLSLGFGAETMPLCGISNRRAHQKVEQYQDA